MAITSFLLAGCATLGFWYRVEFCQAIFLIALPMSIVGILSVRLARRIRRDGLSGAALYHRIRLHRFVIQVIGMISIFITAFWGMWHNMGGAAFGV